MNHSSSSIEINVDFEREARSMSMSTMPSFDNYDDRYEGDSDKNKALDLLHTSSSTMDDEQKKEVMMTSTSTTTPGRRDHSLNKMMDLTLSCSFNTHDLDCMDNNEVSETNSGYTTTSDSNSESSSASTSNCGSASSSNNSSANNSEIPSPMKVSHDVSPINTPWKCPLTIIPQFYFPNKRNCAFNRPFLQDVFTEKKKHAIKTLFSTYPHHSMNEQSFYQEVTKHLLGLPLSCNRLLMKRVMTVYQQYHYFQTGGGGGDSGKALRKQSSSFHTLSTMSLESKHSLHEDTHIHTRTVEFADDDDEDDDDHRRPLTVTCSAMLHYWKHEISHYDSKEHFFRLLKQPHHAYLQPKDLIPLVKEVIHIHPDLSILRTMVIKDYVEKYVITVITRIFYLMNTSRAGQISLKEFRRVDLLNTLHQMEIIDRSRVDSDDEEVEGEREQHIHQQMNDKQGTMKLSRCHHINEEKKFFSYEHFFVLYCTFLELDHDEDTVLHIRELQAYQRYALTPVIINRIYQVGERALTDGMLGYRHKSHHKRSLSNSSSDSDKANDSHTSTPNHHHDNRDKDKGKEANNNKKHLSLYKAIIHALTGSTNSTFTGMSYIDFIYFFLSDIDKTTTMSLNYWFRCIDYDGSGIVTPLILEYLYSKNQMDRLRIAHRETEGRVDVVTSPQIMIQYVLDKLHPDCDRVMSNQYQNSSSDYSNRNDNSSGVSWYYG